jgi:hypothetical protein
MIERGGDVGMDYGWACGITPGLARRRSNFLIPICHKAREVRNGDEHILVSAGENFAKGLESFLLSFFSKIDGYERALRDRKVAVFNVLYLLQDGFRKTHGLSLVLETNA